MKRQAGDWMVTLGYSLTSEEHDPKALVRNAREAEERGFEFAFISDHFHPWISAQGESPFVWGVLGGIANETEQLKVGTGVTCPTIRVHPAIIAQATATMAAMMPDRFWFGVGTGENLNEHVLGDRWPSHQIRLEMLEEALEVIRTLWQGGERDHYGDHYTVENARLYTLPDSPPPIYVAASGPSMAEAAGRMGDGLVSTAPRNEIVERFQGVANEEAPRFGQLTVCWAEDEQAAVRRALESWPNAALPGQLGQDLSSPAHFEQASELVTEDDIQKTVICGPDSDRHVDAIEEYVQAGFDHVYVHQVGSNQEQFFEAYESEVLPAFDGG